MKKVHRFIGPYDLHQPEVILDTETAHQIVDVLKMKTGERVMLCDGKDGEAEYELLEASRGSVRLRRTGDIRDVLPVKCYVTLYAAILKRENFEWAVEKAVECGVSRIVPLITRRTIKKDVKRERLQEIAKEAAEQSGRGIIPSVEEPMSLKEALENAKQNEKNHFLDVEGEGNLKPAASIGLFIGPEGGWDDEEIALAKKTGIVPVSLGPRVLRGETAVAVAVYLMTM